jgi:hypothetical protein
METNEDKKWCVYVHTNKFNGKKYVGITSTKPEDRWRNGRGYARNQHFLGLLKNMVGMKGLLTKSLQKDYH